MPGRYGPASVFFLVDGYDMLAAKVKTLSHEVTALQEQSDGLGDEWEEHSPVGQSRIVVTQDGAFFDTSALNSHAALSGSVPSTPQSTQRVISLGFAGNTAGAPFEGMEGAYSHKYAVVAARAELQKANVEYTISGRRDAGVVIQPLEAKTADWNTETAPVDHVDDPAARSVGIASSSIANPSVITTTKPHRLTNGQKVVITGHSGSSPTINGEHVATVTGTTTFTIPVNVTTGGTGGTLVPSNTLAGGVGYQHVTAFTGFSGFVGKLRDSADDITYADLITFDNVTSAPNAQRKTVAGTIERFVAFDGNGTGTGSITVLCGLSRS